MKFIWNFTSKPATVTNTGSTRQVPHRTDSFDFCFVLCSHTYGITSDPLTQFAVVLSALIHDVSSRCSVVAMKDVGSLCETSNTVVYLVSLGRWIIRELQMHNSSKKGPALLLFTRAKVLQNKTLVSAITH